ncbi:hypothetical protein K438DRAFT_1824958, partial [Mycena galopus ATCC 62051]
EVIFWGLSSSFALAPLFSFPAPPSSTPTYPLQWGNTGTPLLSTGGPGFQMEEEFLATLTDSQVEEEHLGLTWQQQGWHYSRLLTN